MMHRDGRKILNERLSDKNHISHLLPFTELNKISDGQYIDPHQQFPGQIP
jgi:hypothetical protein